MNNGQYKLSKITNVEEVSMGVDLIQLYFGDGLHESVYMFGEYNEVLQYLDKEVIVEFRTEIVKGQLHKVVANLGVVTTVTTLAQEDNIKLFLEEDLEIGTSNILFSELAPGDVVDKAIMYCIDHKYESSAKATWAKLTVLDRKRNMSYLRVFDPDRDSVDLKGSFIKCALRMSDYGLQTQDIMVHSEGSVDSNPLVVIAERAIYNALQDDKILLDYMSAKNILEKMKTYNLEEGLEAGFMTVRLAVELMLIQQTANISKHLDVELLKRMAVCEKAYVVTNKSTTLLSHETQNIILISSHILARDKTLTASLDSNRQINLAECAFYNGIKKAADVVVSMYGVNDYQSFEQFTKGVN